MLRDRDDPDGLGAEALAGDADIACGRKVIAAPSWLVWLAARPALAHFEQVLAQHVL